MKRVLLSLTAVLLAAAAPLALGQETPAKADPAEWVPADALFYAGVTDVGQTWEDFKKTGAYQMISEPSSGDSLPSLNVFGKVTEKLKERVAKSLGIPATQLKNPFGGPLAFYVVLPKGSKMEKAEPGLIAGVGDKELMKKYFDTAVTKLKEAGKLETVSVGPATILSFKFEKEKSKTGPGERKDEPKEGMSEEEEEAEEMPEMGTGSMPEQMAIEMIDQLFSEAHLPETLAACLTDDRLIVGASVDEVKAVLQREKRGQTLAESDDHKALLRNAKPIGNVRLLVNIPRIIEAAKAGTEEEGREDLNKTLKVIGADSLGSAVGHWHTGAAGYDSKIELLFLMHGERSGLAKILSMENRPTAPPATVSADTCFYAGLNLKVPELIDDIERILRLVSPDEADSMRAELDAMELPNGDKFNVRKDFIAHLRGPVLVSLAFAKPLAPDSARLLLSIGHRDQNAMVRFLSAMTGVLEARDVRGTQVYESAEQPGFSVAPTSDRLVAGTAKAVAGTLEPAAGDALAGTEAWKQAAKHLPEEAWLTLFVDKRKLMEVALDIAQSPEQFMGGFGSDMGSMIMMGIVQGMVGEVKAEDQSKARKLLRYTAPAVVAISTMPDGIRITQVELKPAE